MMRNINRPEVDGIAMAVVKEINEEHHEEWAVYLFSMKTERIDLVLVSSRGYGTFNNEEVKTSELRYFLDEMPPLSYRRIELLPDDLLGLSNQYWVSFRENDVLYDKKYVFLAESIKEENMTTLPLIGKKGILLM
jgi:hypothetical protein